MGKTINGKSLSQIMAELAADFPPEAIQTRDYDGVHYINVDDFRSRLNSVVGIDHYNERYTPVEIIQAKDTLAVKTLGTIELLDDDYNVIIVKQSPGGSNIAFPKMEKVDASGKKVTGSDGKPVMIPGNMTNSIPNDLDSACQDAFKRICRNKFDMGKRQLKDAGKGTLYEITLTQNMNSYNGHLFGEGVCKNDGSKYKIAVFKNTVEAFQTVYGTPKNNSVIFVYGKLGEDKKGNPQIIVSEAAPNKAASDNGNKKPAEQANNNSAAGNSTANKPTESKPAQTESRNQGAEKPQENMIMVELATLTVLTAYGEKGNVCFKAADKKNNEYVCVIEASKMAMLDQNKWTTFKEKAEKAKGIHQVFGLVKAAGKPNNYFVRKIA